MISALYTSNYYFLVKHGNGKSSIVVFLVDFSVERHPFTGDFPSQPGCIKPFFLATNCCRRLRHLLQQGTLERQRWSTWGWMMTGGTPMDWKPIWKPPWHLLSQWNFRTKMDDLFHGKSYLPSGKHTKNHGKSPFYSWVNPLFLLPFSIAFCKFTRPGINGWLGVYPHDGFTCLWWDHRTKTASPNAEKHQGWSSKA